MSCTSFLDGKVMLHAGDCLDVLPTLEAESIDSVVCDPPYHLTSGNVSTDWSSFQTPKGTTNKAGRAHKTGFMGKQWDGGDVAFRIETWAAILRVFKPGGHLVAFSGTRTYHRMVCAIEDAGFEIRDQLAWVYGSGFPKSHDVSKGIDKAAGAEREVIGPAPYSRGKAGQSYSETRKVSYDYDPLPLSTPATAAARQWQGFGTALKPAWEPIVLARKPLIGTVVANVLKHGTGALNIDGCRVEAIDHPGIHKSFSNGLHEGYRRPWRDGGSPEYKDTPIGRWPANLVTDGSPEVLAGFPDRDCGMSIGRNRDATQKPGGYDGGWNKDNRDIGYNDSGSAARFFYTAKADADDRLGSKHPTVKPVDLMQWLVRLVTPPGGRCLDPFAGTGTTGEAAFREGMRAILIEREAEYQADIARRMKLCVSGTDERKRESLKASGKIDLDAGPLFAGAMS